MWDVQPHRTWLFPHQSRYDVAHGADGFLRLCRSNCPNNNLRDTMLTDIKGLVDRLELSQAKGMMPLFEAISNAIDAIEEHKDGFAKHSIRIRLVAAHDLAHQGGDDTLVLDGLTSVMTAIWPRSKRRIRLQKSKSAARAWGASRS